jgi:sulfite reductase (NADPH) flavoprotein alpha-component
MASLTGIILALGASYNEIKHDYDLSELNLAQTVETFQAQYSEVYEFQIDDNYFFRASVVDKQGQSLNGYFNPETAAFQERKHDMPSWYLSTLNFHRSLFLKSTGRLLVGISSFLLFLMAFSGLGLLIARQGNLKAAFSKIIKLDSESFYHIVLGRWTLIPVLIIALSGVFLSLFRFDTLPAQDQGTLEKGLPRFSDISLADLHQLDFPFSKDEEDYFYIETRAFQGAIDQYKLNFTEFQNKDIFSANYDLISDLHTGRGSAWYALILFIASVNMIYFLYSGMLIFLRRFKKRKTKIQVAQDFDSPDWLILYGSESGSTESLSYLLSKKLSQRGNQVKVCALNDYKSEMSAERTLILTATYGEGEAPFNADEFFEQVQENPTFFKGHELALLGFGSSQYKHFCGFAKALSPLIASNNRFFIPPRFIDNFSFQTLEEWLEDLNRASNNNISLKRSELLGSRKAQEFELLERWDEVIEESDLFNLRLSPAKKSKFESGDLLGISLKNDQERLYSISKIGKDILLSVKRLENGLGSNYLADLELGENIRGHILKNEHFHLPKGKTPVLMIANGTGIAPFIGMIKEEANKRPIYLYLGLRYRRDFQLYEPWIAMEDLAHFELVLSKEHNMKYVQDALEKSPRMLQDIYEQKGHIMVCGAKSMERDLRNIEIEALQNSIKAGRFLSDCY